MMKFNYKLSTINSQKGVAILFTLLISGILLSIVFTLSAIFIPKLRVASDIKSSVGAIYAADSAAEWCLYMGRIGDTSAPVMENGSSYIVEPPNCSSSPIKATGTYNKVTRAYEVSF